MASTSRVRQLLPGAQRRSHAGRPPPDALAVPLTGPPLQLEPPVQRAVDTVIEERRVPAWQRQLVHRLVVMDFLAAALAAVLAVTLRFGQDISDVYLLASAALPFVWVGACTSTRAYEPRFLGTGSEEFRRVFDAGVRLLALVALTSYAFKLDLARLYVLLALPLSVGLTLLLRYAARQWLHRMRAAGRCLHRVVVVGRERSCAELVRQLRREQPRRLLRRRRLRRPRAGRPTVEGVPIVGTSTTIVEALRAHRRRHGRRRRLVRPHAGRPAPAVVAARGQRRRPRRRAVADRHRRPAHPHPPGRRPAAAARRGAGVRRRPPPAQGHGRPGDLAGARCSSCSRCCCRSRSRCA